MKFHEGICTIEDKVRARLGTEADEKEIDLWSITVKSDCS